MTHTVRMSLLVPAALLVLATGCQGAAGSSCSVTDNGDGTATVACTDGTSATIRNGSNGVDGTDGTDGTSCTVDTNSDGSRTLSCTDGTSVTLTDGADGSSCSVVGNANGSKTISCTDGTAATLSDGTSCTVADNGDGTKTISCEDGTSATVSDGTDGTSCTVADNGDGTVTMSCTDGTSATWRKAGFCNLVFDDAWAANGQGSNPDDFYGPGGVHFDNTAGYGLVGGQGNGDPGNWDLEGTNGSAAWGLWGGTHAISFTTPVRGVAFDFLRGHSDVTDLQVDAYLGTTLVASQTVSFTGAWGHTRVDFSAHRIDRVTWSSSQTFGLDNVQFEGATACPF